MPGLTETSSDEEGEARVETESDFESNVDEDWDRIARGFRVEGSGETCVTEAARAAKTRFTNSGITSTR